MAFDVIIQNPPLRRGEGFDLFREPPEQILHAGRQRTGTDLPGIQLGQHLYTDDLSAGLDGEVGLNARRQEVAAVFRRMAGLRASETLIPNGGTGYRFNNEGNQVSYRCDVKRVVTINFDRNKVRKMCGDLSKKADDTSNALDAALVNSKVDYVAPFDVNDTFADVFESFIGEQATA